jgi:hypothetical protein
MKDEKALEKFKILITGKNYIYIYICMGKRVTKWAILIQDVHALRSICTSPWPNIKMKKL